jgi:hypothetical protein
VTSRPRIRTIKPELFLDEKVQALPSPARLLFIGLISHADDEGRLAGDPRVIRAQVFPMDALPVAKVAAWLKQMAQLGLIRRYEADGFLWIEITNWRLHQRINRPRPSTIPPYDSPNGDAPSAP